MNSNDVVAGVKTTKLFDGLYPDVKIYKMGGTRLTYKVVTDHDHTEVPNNHHVVLVNTDISFWIESQPIQMWKFVYTTPKNYYVISDELLAWLKLRWS